MSSAPGPQVQANKHAHRNRPSGIDELRDNIADITSSVGDSASRKYEQAHHVAADAVEETVRIIKRNPVTSIAVGLGLGFLLGIYPYRRSRSPSLTTSQFCDSYRRFPWLKNRRR